MSTRRRRPAPLWQRVAAVAVMVIAAALVILLLSPLFSGNLRLSPGSDGRDPQFAEPAGGATRPPELYGEGEDPQLLEDPSAGWDLGEQTPVDKTAEQLSQEAAAGQ